MITAITEDKIDYCYDGSLHLSNHDNKFWWIIDYPMGDDHVKGVIQDWKEIPKSLYDEILKFNKS